MRMELGLYKLSHAEVMEREWDQRKKHKEKFGPDDVLYVVVPQRWLERVLCDGINSPARVHVDESGRIIIFLSRTVPKEWRRYVIYHEWQEGLRGRHKVASKEELLLAQQELKEEYTEYLKWRVKEVSPSPRAL